MVGYLKNHRGSGQALLCSGFSLVEIIVAIAVTGILASVAMAMMTGTKSAVAETKLRTDVARLNQIISLYLADGGSLDGVATAQEVLEKLKTVRSNASAKRHVGGLTGRGVDVRLSVQMQTKTLAGTKEPRAVWNATSKRFDILSTEGPAGISDFVLDDNLLATNYPTETRARSSVLYNGGDGWIWEPGNHSAAALLNPSNATLAIQDNLFDPTAPPPSTEPPPAGTTGGSTTGGGNNGNGTGGGTGNNGNNGNGTTTGGGTTGTATTTLPKPINGPNGGTFSAANFPTSITINKNGASATGSQLKYRVNNGSWINYTGAFTVNSGDKIDSKNFSTDLLLYSDSSTDSDTYFMLVERFIGHTHNTWTNVSGGPNLKHTISNGTPDKTSLSHGDTRLDLGGGEYLDAGVENTLTFDRQPFNNVAPNTDFTLGELVILNGTTFNDSEATAATLSMTLTLTQPVHKEQTIALNLTMVSTSNSSDRLASADIVTLNTPVTAFTVSTGGVTYTLQVKLVNLDETSGTVSGNTFYIYEGASARATLVGRFVSNK